MKNMIWGLLPMAAALMLTACSSNDIEDVAEKPATKTIPFTAKVSTENATRISAEEGSGTYTLKFTAGDKLHVQNVTSGDIILSGLLDIDPADVGKTTATFTGELTYTPRSSDPSTPAGDLQIYATLVPEHAPSLVFYDICSSVTEAIQTYSYLENIITYSQLSSFTFVQSAAFVDFDITLSGTNAPAVGTDVNIAVDGSSVFSDDPSNPYEFSYTSTATVTSGGKVKFAIPVDASTDDYTATLKDASVTISNASYQGTCSFADATGFEVGPKVYRAARTINTWAAAGHALTSAVVGEIIGSDGKAYAAADKDNLPSGVTAVAMVAYLGSASDCTNGLAIALENVSSSSLRWDNSGSKNGGKTAAEWCNAWNESTSPNKVTGGTWRLPTIIDWQYMLIGCGATGTAVEDPRSTYMKYDGLTSYLSAAGGATLTSFYWSSTEVNVNYAMDLNFTGGSDGALFTQASKTGECGVRACLAF